MTRQRSLPHVDLSLVDVASMSYHDHMARCCQYTFDLLVKYLHAANQMALLSLLNAHVAVTVTSGDPSPHEDEEDAAARTVITGRGLHSSTFQLNLSAFCGIGGAFRGCLGCV